MDYTYRKETDLLNVTTSKSILLSEIGNWDAVAGGDSPEAQWIAVKNIFADFGGSGRRLVIIINTDARAHAGGSYPTEGEIAALLLNNHAKLIITLGIGGDEVDPYPSYSDFISRYKIDGVVLRTNSTDSSTFFATVKAGLGQVCAGRP